MNKPDSKWHMLCGVTYIMCPSHDSHRQWRNGCQGWGSGGVSVSGDRVSVLETDGEMMTPT